MLRLVERRRVRGALSEVAAPVVCRVNGAQAGIETDDVHNLAGLHAESGIEIRRLQRRDARPLRMIPRVHRAFHDVERDGYATAPLVECGAFRGQRGGPIPAMPILLAQRAVRKIIDERAGVVRADHRLRGLDEIGVRHSGCAFEAKRTHRQADVGAGDAEQLLLPPGRGVHATLADDLSPDAAAVEQRLKRPRDEGNDLLIRRQGTVERRHRLADRRGQLLIGEPDEVVEDDGIRPRLVWKLEHHIDLPPAVV